MSGISCAVSCLLLCFIIASTADGANIALYQYSKVQNGIRLYRYQLGGSINEGDGWTLMTGDDNDNDEISYAIMKTGSGGNAYYKPFYNHRGTFRSGGNTYVTDFHSSRSESSLRGAVRDYGGDDLDHVERISTAFYKLSSGGSVLTSVDCSKDGIMTQHLGKRVSCPAGYRKDSSTKSVVAFGVACPAISDPNAAVTVTANFTYTVLPQAVSFSCRHSPDYDMDTTCVDGTWTPELPVCPQGQPRNSFLGEVLGELATVSLPQDEEKALTALAEVRGLAQILAGMEKELLTTLELPTRQ